MLTAQWIRISIDSTDSSNTELDQMPRYALLRHTGAPDDPSGCHYDLLLEDGDACRTWRLPMIPRNDSSPQHATPLPAHRLIWLMPRSAAVSGGRGWAERIASGTWQGSLPEGDNTALRITMETGPLQGTLEISSQECRLHPTKKDCDVATANKLS